MKLLIAVVTCHKFKKRADAQRRTWVPDARALGIDVIFFLGRESGIEFDVIDQQDDSVILDVKDDYESLPSKVRAMFQWASHTDYDFVLKTDDDVLINPENLLRDIERAQKPLHYLGHSNGKYCSGFGYVVSSEGVKAIAAADLNGDNVEDRWAGTVLGQAGYQPINSQNFLIYRPQLGYRCRGHWRGSAQGWRECQYCQTAKDNAAVVCALGIDAYSNCIENLYRDSRQQARSKLSDMSAAKTALT